MAEYKRVRELLTQEERQKYQTIPKDISEWAMGTYFTLTAHDISLVNQHRRGYNRIGFAVQLCVLRYSGWPLSDTETIPSVIVEYIGSQIGVYPDEFLSYGTREATKWEHMQEIRESYGYMIFDHSTYRKLMRHLQPYALVNSNTSYLIQTSIHALKEWKYVLPAISAIERLVWECRRRTDNLIFRKITETLTPEQTQRMDELLSIIPDGTTSYLSWLKEVPGSHSPDSFMKVIERLEYIRSIGLKPDFSDIHANRLRQLSRTGSRFEPYAFRRFDDNRRYAMLVVFLYDLTQDMIDQAFEIHDRQMMTLLNKGKKAHEELQRKNGRSINEKVIQFASVGEVLIEAKATGKNPFEMLEKVLPWSSLIKAVEEAKALSRPVDNDYLDLLETRFPYLRKYTPTLLNSLEFRSSQSSDSLLQAVDVIRKMNDTRQRKIPEDAPLDFIRDRWQKHIYDEDGSINRRYYEMATLTELRHAVRSGDVSIVGSRQHKDFDEYIVNAQEWETVKNTKTRLAVSHSAEEFLNERVATLSERFHSVVRDSETLKGVSISDGKLHVNRLEKDIPEEAQQLSRNLYAMLPRVKLTDILLEVAQWTGFEKQFTHVSTGRGPSPEENHIILAALMAMGTNIGLTKMADATRGITYRQMANVSQWRLHEDAMNRAQSALVNFHHKSSLSGFWGDGTTSSSDGMRMQIAVSSLHADFNPHYGSGKGATIYRFTSDQFSSFYTKVINTNARDAVHVIDGLLHHETDLDIHEHYTDTAGYTDKVFGLTHLLGFRFAPRLRDISDAKLYTIGKMTDSLQLSKLLKGNINTRLIQENYDDVLRLAHSIREGRVSGSLIMGKLGSYARQNKIAKALSEMGRIEKTIFIMEYISSEPLRRRIQRGLNKGEAMNSLARAIFFGKYGEFREKALQDQLQRASALNIIINAICIWNTVYLTEALLHIGDKDLELLLPHISPLGWEHINFLGEYSFNNASYGESGTLRPLNLSNIKGFNA